MKAFTDKSSKLKLLILEDRFFETKIGIIFLTVL